MSGLANANDRARAVRALQRAGFEAHEGGSHTILVHPVTKKRTVVSRQPKLKLRVLRMMLKQCGLTEQDYLALYR